LKKICLSNDSKNEENVKRQERYLKNRSNFIFSFEKIKFEAFLFERKSKESEFSFYVTSQNRVDLTEKSEPSRYNSSKLVV
jgi:hypothetical protein